MKKITLLFVLCILHTVALHADNEFVDPNPSNGNRFGEHVVVLTNGNVVISSPQADLNGKTNCGAVYLFNGSSHALISTLYGSTDNDQIGYDGVTALPGGYYVVCSHYWDNGAINSAGAATFCNGTSGINGAVSAGNSLVGSTASDQAGSGGIKVLSNGNFIVFSPYWNGGRGAVTWCGGTTGLAAAISSSNSLVGQTAYDNVGWVSSNQGVLALSNGNYIVSSPNWDNGSNYDAGAVTWCNGASGTSGLISSINSLVTNKANVKLGNSPDDIVGLTNGNYVVICIRWTDDATNNKGSVTWGSGTGGVSGVISSSNSLVGTTSGEQVGSKVVRLTNGHYVVGTFYWDNGGTDNVGAATWCDGTTGRTGFITTGNSLYGSTAEDRISNGGITALTNGNYVVISTGWDNGATTDVGAVTWCNGSIVTSTTVKTSNSLYGAKKDDYIGEKGITLLTNGNYVVSSPSWDNGSISNAGAATWCNGTTGRTGAVGTGNSLYGTTALDRIGNTAVMALANGNYMVFSQNWTNAGTLSNAGAATWCDGTVGRTGSVTTANSLYGTAANDFINPNVGQLDGGNYVVMVPNWNNGSVSDAGAAMYCNGSTAPTGPFTSSNSLVGTQALDMVGGIFKALTNGNYVMHTNAWNNGTVTRAGSVTLCNGTTGLIGAVSSSNSLVGTTANDQVGSGYSVTALNNGNYVAATTSFNNSGSASAGAATWGSGTAGVSGIITNANSIIGPVSNSSMRGVVTNDTYSEYYVRFSPQTATGRVFYASYNGSATTYALTYNANGGSGNVPVDASSPYAAAATVTVKGNVGTPTILTRTGYAFSGWNTQSDGNGTTYQADATFSMPANAVILYARWLPTSTVTFDVAGGTPAIDPITQVEGTPVTAPANPTKAGFTFQGWVPAVPATMPVDDMTCVAQWQINQAPDIAAVGGSTTVIDRTNYLIYGLSVRLTSLNSYIEPVGGATLEVIKSSGTICGTGTVVNVKSNGVTVKIYKVVIFGDVNGDGNIDSMDAGMIVDYENYMISLEGCYLKAGDVNGDGNVDSIDAAYVVDCENYLITINQVTGLAN